MIHAAAHEWLPASVAERSEIRAKIDKAVADWSADWFMTRKLSVTGARSVPVSARIASDRRRHGVATMIGGSKRAMSMLLDWALDERLDQAPVTVADQQVIDGFEQKLIDDLASKLETALAVAPAVPASTPGKLGQLELLLGESASGDLLSVALPIEALLPIVRSSMDTPLRKASVTNIVQALSPTDATLQITLGKADIRLADLRALTVGDILILDTPLDGAGEVSLTGGKDIFARAVLTDIDGQMAVTLEA